RTLILRTRKPQYNSRAAPTRSASCAANLSWSSRLGPFEPRTTAIPRDDGRAALLLCPITAAQFVLQAQEFRCNTERFLWRVLRFEEHRCLFPLHQGLPAFIQHLLSVSPENRFPGLESHHGSRVTSDSIDDPSDAGRNERNRCSCNQN